MSMKYKNYNVTLDNYKEIFAQCTPDILDEIRSAILDDTQIEHFIQACGKDNYKLGQFRMAVREFVPPKYLNVKLTGKTVYYIRQAFVKQFNLEPLVRYYDGNTLTLEADIVEKIAELVSLGVDVSKVNFNKIPINLVEIFCKGLYQGYPMWLCEDIDRPVSVSYISLLMQGMKLGIDIHPFIEQEWEEDQIRLLFVYSNRINLNELLQYITPKFEDDVLNELVSLMGQQIPITDLVRVDTEGYPVYNAYQIFALGEAIKNKVATQQMFNPSLRDTEIAEMMNVELAKKNRKLSATLGKN